MAVAREALTAFNTPTTLNLNASTVGSFLQVDIPAATTLMLLFVCGYPQGSALNHYSSGTIEIGGSGGVVGGGGGTNMSVAVVGDTNTATMLSSLFYLNAPPTGNAKQIAWDFAGTEVADTGHVMVCVFYSGTHASTPIGASDVTQVSGTPAVSDALANSVNDLVAGFGGYFSSGTPTETWTNVTEVLNGLEKDNTFASYGDTAGTGSPIAPSFSWTGGDDGAVIGVVVKAAAGGGGATLALMGQASF